MAAWTDVRRIAMKLPGAAERSSRGLPQWRVGDRLFVWERPLRRADLEALGGNAPDGEILGARVADLGVKEALIADDLDVYFTTPHFDGYPAILVRLDRIAVGELEELITEAWLVRAPKRLATEYLRRYVRRYVPRAGASTDTRLPQACPFRSSAPLVRRLRRLDRRPPRKSPAAARGLTFTVGQAAQ